MLEINNISKSFKNGGKTIKVLNDVSFKCRGKEILLVEGPSGSGKTTLLNIISLILKPDSGKIFIKNKEIDWRQTSEVEEIRKKNIGYCFQEFYLFPNLTVMENVILPALSLKPFEELETEAEKLLEELEISHLKNRYPSEISGGEKQRVTLARALINKPEILLLDEPTGNLDRTTAQQVIEMIPLLAEKFGACIVVASHDQLMKNLANNIVSLG